MAKASSTVQVNIVGDSKGLSKELDKADRGIKGLAGSAKGLVGAFALVGAGAAVADFAAGALDEADRLGDAQTRLELQLGDLSDQLIETADDYTNLGQSAQDILELEAAFADVATAMGIADPLIAQTADDVAATAAAVALLTDLEPAQVVEAIGKAAGGSEKALKTLGIDLDEDAVQAAALAISGKDSADALTEGEIAAGRLTVILEELKPKLDAATGGLNDTEQSAGALQAKFETLQGRIGTLIDPFLTGLFTGLIEGGDAWARMFDEMGKGDWSITQEEIGETFGLLGDLNDLINDVIGGLQDITGARIPTRPRNRPSTQNTGGGGGGGDHVTLIVQPSAHDDIEREVVNALRDHNRRQGIR